MLLIFVGVSDVPSVIPEENSQRNTFFFNWCFSFFLFQFLWFLFVSIISILHCLGFVYSSFPSFLRCKLFDLRCSYFSSMGICSCTFLTQHFLTLFHKFLHAFLHWLWVQNAHLFYLWLLSWPMGYFVLITRYLGFNSYLSILISDLIPLWSENSFKWFQFF